MTDTTNHKAVAGSLGSGFAAGVITLSLFWAGPSIGLTPPDVADAVSAYTVVGITAVTTIGGAIAGYVAAWFGPANKPK